MLINKPITDSFAVGLKFRLLLNDTVRDLCHAYLAISDRMDRESCVRTLHAACAVLSEAYGQPVNRPRKLTGISDTSLRMTLGSIISVAEAFAAEYDALIEDATTTPDDLSHWLTSRGEMTLRGLSLLITDLLTEENLRRIHIRTDTSIV